jgi:hypothetical protein
MLPTPPESLATINTKVEPIAMVVYGLVCTRRLRTPLTVKKLFAVREKTSSKTASKLRISRFFEDTGQLGSLPLFCMPTA